MIEVMICPAVAGQLQQGYDVVAVALWNRWN
jgi:hypothetical protein